MSVSVLTARGPLEFSWSLHETLLMCMCSLLYRKPGLCGVKNTCTGNPAVAFMTLEKCSCTCSSKHLRVSHVIHITSFIRGHKTGLYSCRCTVISIETSFAGHTKLLLTHTEDTTLVTARHMDSRYRH